MKAFPGIGLAVALAAMGFGVAASDGHPWRGPQRSGVAPTSPPLIESFSTHAWRERWRSEPIPSDRRSGFGSPTVAGGRMYLFLGWKHEVPVATRTLNDAGLRKLVWSPSPRADSRRVRVEEARLSSTRGPLEPRAIRPWVDQWLKAHLSEKENKRHGAILRERLTQGPSAVPFFVRDRLATISETRRLARPRNATHG